MSDSPYTATYRRFIDSLNIDYMKWHEGIGYDLEALRAMAAPERAEAVEVLRRMEPGWREIECMTDDMEKRLSRLEREADFWRVAWTITLCVTLVSVAALLFETLHVPSSLRARRFSLVDDANHETARMANTPDGPALVVDGKSEQDHAVLSGSGLGVILHNQTRLNLDVGKGGSPSLGLSRVDGKTSVMLGISDEDSSAHLILLSPNEGPKLYVNLGREPKFKVMAYDGTDLVSLPLPASK